MYLKIKMYKKENFASAGLSSHSDDAVTTAGKKIYSVCPIIVNSHWVRETRGIINIRGLAQH